MRKASITMSWLAEAKATTIAHRAVTPGLVEGSVWPSMMSEMISAICVTSAQLRRRPSRRVSQGTGAWSMIGAQTNLKL